RFQQVLHLLRQADSSLQFLPSGCKSSLHCHPTADAIKFQQSGLLAGEEMRPTGDDTGSPENRRTTRGQRPWRSTQDVVRGQDENFCKVAAHDPGIMGIGSDSSPPNDHLYLTAIADTLVGRARTVVEIATRLIVLGVALCFIYFG